MAPSKKQQVADLRSVKKHAAASVKESKKSTKAALKHQENKKKSTIQKGTRSSTKESVSDLSAVSSSTCDQPEPPYRFEVHVKKAQVLVDVTLHKVPPQHIDISQCTTRSLVVDCKKHTKPYRLHFDLPHKMTMDPEKATYSFENGILRCVLQCDRISPEAVKERHEFIEKVTAAKSLRFRMSKEGEVVVRSRKSKLHVNVTPNTDPAVQKAKGNDKDENGASPKTTKNINKSNDKTIVKTIPKDDDKIQQKSKNKLVSDDKIASLAASTGAINKMTLSEKIKNSTQELAKREQRLAHRKARKENKKEKETVAFGRIVSEQQRRLQEREVLSAPVQKSTSGKRIAFG